MVEWIRCVPFKKESMSKTLGGFLFIRDASLYDYCFIQAITSLAGCCDQVIVIAFTDNRQDYNAVIAQQATYTNIVVYELEPALWIDMHGKTKLANFQNIAAMMLDTDYQLLVQADEIIHPDSYTAIRQAIETGAEGLLCERVNLWGSPNTMLVVPQNRQPCSTQIIRLTKRGYWCYDDGESIAAPATADFVDKIKIIHYGFVRKREVMKAKIINMQEGVFAMAGHDHKLDQCEVFDPTLWFKGSDLAPINFAHPPIMKDWVLERM